MCIVVFLWQAHPLYPLILLHNRDEFHHRATKAASWWEDAETEILGGRDEVAGGTWLSCSRDGRIAFLTNVAESHPRPEARTRGELSVRFLKSRMSPREFAEEIKAEGEDFNGFNLVVGDIESKSMVYMSNRGTKEQGGGFLIEEVKQGLHVLSNAQLDSPWPKAERLRVRFQEEVANYAEDPIPLDQIAASVMKDSVKTPPAPHIPPQKEDPSRSIFVHCQTPLGVFGTRNIVALSATWSGEVRFYEMYLDVDDTNTWKDHLFTFYIQHSCFPVCRILHDEIGKLSLDTACVSSSEL